ncbi:MAG: hypothetical protein KAU50_07780 [Candidatus Marinimicrobia bacterium]|nr:hypothetical protein [Candidatus Neomarinimicrobiota bacterium]
MKRMPLITYINRLIIVPFLFWAALITSCGILEPEEEKKAKVEVISTTKGMKSYNSPFITITIKNTGNATAYNVSCDVQAIRGNLIVDSGFAYFAGGGDIRPGMSAVDEAIFFDLESHSDYDRLEYELDWIQK